MRQPNHKLGTKLLSELVGESTTEGSDVNVMSGYIHITGGDFVDIKVKIKNRLTESYIGLDRENKIDRDLNYLLGDGKLKEVNELIAYLKQGKEVNDSIKMLELLEV